MSYTTIRLLIALAAKYNLTIHQMDVKSAYLNGEIDTDIYIEQPQLFEERNKAQWVCKLKKGLYGLKQAGRIWHETLHKYLLSKEYTQLESEPSVYIKKLDQKILVIAVYVNDLQIFSNNIKILE